MIVIPLAYHGFHRFGEASEAIRKADAEALAWRQARRARGTRKTPGEAVSSGESAMDPVGNVGKSAWNAGFTWIYQFTHRYTLTRVYIYIYVYHFMYTYQYKQYIDLSIYIYI